jgi:N4-gp56 family major capsid protein
MPGDVPQGFDSNHPLTNKLWSEGLEAEALKKISYAGFMGKRSDSLIQWKDGLSKKAGSDETIGLRMQLETAPKSSVDTVESNEESLTIHNMNFTIDETVDAVRFKNIIDRQHVNFDMRDEAKAALADQLSNALDKSFFVQGAGFTPETHPTFYGHNSVVAPSAEHHLFTDPLVSTDEGLSDDTFDLDILDIAVERAKLLSPSIRPANIPGLGEMYVWFIHPSVTTQLRKSTTRWSALSDSMIQGGFINKNPLFTGSLGIWNGTLIVENSRVTDGVLSTDAAVSVPGVKRTLFCGAQSAVMGWGRLGGNPNRFRWVEKHFDYDREYGIMGGCLNGIKKCRYDNKDFATIVISGNATAS